MALFNLGKKKEDCCCKSVACSKDEAGAEGRIKVLGSGCKKCNELEAAVREAMEELKLSETIEHVTDFTQIAAYGVMSTPALVIDHTVVSYGKVLNKEEAKEILKKYC